MERVIYVLTFPPPKENHSPQTTAVWLLPPPRHSNCQATATTGKRPLTEAQNHPSVFVGRDIVASQVTAGQLLFELCFPPQLGILSALPVPLLIPFRSPWPNPLLCLLLQGTLSPFHLTLVSSTVSSTTMVSTAICKLMIPNFYLPLSPLQWLPDTYIHLSVRKISQFGELSVLKHIKKISRIFSPYNQLFLRKSPSWLMVSLSIILSRYLDMVLSFIFNHSVSRCHQFCLSNIDKICPFFSFPTSNYLRLDPRASLTWTITTAPYMVLQFSILTPSNQPSIIVPKSSFQYINLVLLLLRHPTT